MKTLRTTKAMTEWLATAAPGSTAVYHEGSLFLDRSFTLGNKVIQTIASELANRAWHAYKAGTVELAQKRLDEDHYLYLMQKKGTRT